MNRSVLMLLLVASAFGCGGAGLVLKQPIAEQCGTTGLRGCSQLTDGVLLYVEGDAEAGRRKITEAAAQNSPEKIRLFAASLRGLRQVPGADSFMGPVLEVVTLLDPQGGGAAPAGGVGAVAPSMGPDATAAQVGVQDRRPAADTVLEQIESGITTVGTNPRRVACSGAFGDGSGYCVELARGPFIMTDVHSVAGCANDLAVMASDGKAVRWWMSSTSTSPLVAHGARFSVKPGEALFLGAAAESEAALSSDPRCTVAWSGFRPYSPEGKPVGAAPGY